MTIETTRQFFLTCTVINMAMLMCWFTFFAIGHDWMRDLHGRWFKLSDESFDAIHYAGMAFYKLSIFLFNLVPYIALLLLS